MSNPFVSQFEELLEELWLQELSGPAIGGLCILCGNTGHIDTRGKVFDRRGNDVGGEADCICPNGRALHNSGI